VLSLDGGGAKGFYTLGALNEIEALIGGKLCTKFDLIFGASTGAIIAALLGLSYAVEDIKALYSDHVVKVMGRWLPSRKSAALEVLAAEVFGEQRFDSFRTRVGIVGTRWDDERPIIFKTHADQAYTGAATFQPGFGATIGDAVVGSCSAYPFFSRKFVDVSGSARIQVGDRGYVANNPTLYTIADATELLGFAREEVRVVSIGVGEYPSPKLRMWKSAQVAREIAVRAAPAKVAGDKYAVDGPTPEGPLPRGSDHSHQQSLHPAADGDGHVRGEPRQAQPYLRPRTGFSARAGAAAARVLAVGGGGGHRGIAARNLGAAGEDRPVHRYL
jgi:patatin-like phospholipase/acyl hydrolase